MSILSPVTLAIDVKMDQGLSQVFEKYKYVLRISLKRHIVIDYRDYHDFDNFFLKIGLLANHFHNLRRKGMKL